MLALSRQWLRLHNARQRAACKLQRVGLGFLGRCRARRSRRDCTRLALLLQARARGMGVRRALRLRRTQATRDAEFATAGRALYAVVVDKQTKLQAVNASRQPDHRAAGELQRLFSHYARGPPGDDGLPVMEVHHFMSFCRDTGVVTKQFSAFAAEAVFREVQPPMPPRVLTYARFATAVDRLAEERSKSVETWGKLKGSDARLARLLLRVVFVSDTAKRLLAGMDEAERYPARWATSNQARRRMQAYHQRLWLGCTDAIVWQDEEPPGSQGAVSATGVPGGQGKEVGHKAAAPGQGERQAHAHLPGGSAHSGVLPQVS
jgi:hypothetical protein